MFHPCLITTNPSPGVLAPPHRLRFSFYVSTSILLHALASASAAADLGWDYQPYRIRAVLAIDAPGGLSQQLADELPQYLKGRVHAAIGPLWSFDIDVATGAARGRLLAEMDARHDKPPTEFPADGDKLLLLAVRWTPAGLELIAREFDRYVERWGMPIRTECHQELALPEQLFAIACQAVAPLVQLEFDPEDEQRVRLLPRGAALLRENSGVSSIKAGDVLLPLLRRTARGGELLEGGIVVVPWTYVEVADSDTLLARIHSANRRPFGIRRQGRVEQLAIGLRALPAETVLRLHSRTAPDKPLVGYEVFSQKPGDEVLSLLGTTDREGKLTVPPGETRIRTLYLKNGGQLLARLPIVPGADGQIDVPLPDDDPRLAAEARLAALREELIDVVARRNILMARARQKMKESDFAAAQKLLATADELPGRSQFNLTLTTAARSLRSDDPQIQRRIDQLVEGTQTVMNQYLDLRPINQLHDELRAAQRKGT
ncbi:MAG: hypothetical protein WD738_23990 [Pirellulales bacterium]